MEIKDLDQSEEMKEALTKFAISLKGFFLLSGTNGTGKTVAAMSVYESITPFKLPAYDHDVAIFITQAELNIWWSEWISKYGETNSLLKKVCKTKLLILDDLGTRTPSDTFMDFLYAIADFRWRNRDKIGTIITTNLNSTDLRQRFTDAFFSRVASGIVFRLDGQDRRFNHKEF